MLNYVIRQEKGTRHSKRLIRNEKLLYVLLLIAFSKVDVLIMIFDAHDYVMKRAIQNSGPNKNYIILAYAIQISRPLPDEDPGPVMIPIGTLTTIPPTTEKSEVRDIFSEISPIDEQRVEQRNQNECKLQNIYETQKPIDLCSQ